MLEAVLPIQPHQVEPQNINQMPLSSYEFLSRALMSDPLRPPESQVLSLRRRLSPGLFQDCLLSYCHYPIQHTKGSEENFSLCQRLCACRSYIILSGRDTYFSGRSPPLNALPCPLYYFPREMTINLKQQEFLFQRCQWGTSWRL